MSTEFDEEFLDGLTRAEWLERSDKVRALAWRDAQEKVSGMGLETKIDLPREISGLYSRANKQYTRDFDNLKNEFGDRLPELFAYAQWVKWIACWDGAYWFLHSIEHGVVLDNNYTRSFCTAAGYARNEGWACTVFDKLAELAYQPFFQAMSEKFGLKEKPSDSRVLDALELQWLRLASESSPTHDEFLEFLHEAGEAGALSSGLNMWNEGGKCAIEEMETDPNSKAALLARRLVAKTAASARHAQSQAVREQVIARYKAEKGIFSSKDAAAISFTKDFPFEFSTIRDWLKGA